MKEIVQHRFRHAGFGLYSKYDTKKDLITLWLTQPSDANLLLQNILDSNIDLLGNRESGFKIVKEEGEAILKKKELEELTKNWPISITGPLSEKDMADCFEMIDYRFEQFEAHKLQS